MVDQATDFHDLDEDEQELGDESERPTGWRALLRNKKVLILGGAVLLIVVGAGIASLFVGGDPDAPAVVDVAPVQHYTFKEIWGDLKPTGRRAHYIKMTVVVDVPTARGVERLTEMEVPIIDGFRTFLRDKTRDDLMGEEGTKALKSGLLSIVNKQIAPSKALRIYFQDLVTQ